MYFVSTGFHTFIYVRNRVVLQRAAVIVTLRRDGVFLFFKLPPIILHHRVRPAFAAYRYCFHSVLLIQD